MSDAEIVDALSGTVVRVENTTAYRRGPQPPPWLADIIAAAYRGDEPGIVQAASHLGPLERQQLHTALRRMVVALMHERFETKARRNITLTVEEPDG